MSTAIPTRKSIAIGYGFIAGALLAGLIFVMSPMIKSADDMQKAEGMGMVGMALGLSMIYLGIRAAKTKVYAGQISFRDAFRTGITITFIGSLCYVAAWMIYFNLIDDSFISIYLESQTDKIMTGDGTDAEKIEQVKQLTQMMEQYRSLPVMFIYTFGEIFPFGLIVTLICSWLMKKRGNN